MKYLQKVKVNGVVMHVVKTTLKTATGQIVLRLSDNKDYRLDEVEII